MMIITYQSAHLSTTSQIYCYTSCLYCEIHISKGHHNIHFKYYVHPIHLVREREREVKLQMHCMCNFKRDHAHIYCFKYLRTEPIFYSFFKRYIVFGNNELYIVHIWFITIYFHCPFVAVIFFNVCDVCAQCFPSMASHITYVLNFIVPLLSCVVRSIT